jgi:hypothetical protein
MKAWIVTDVITHSVPRLVDIDVDRLTREYDMSKGLETVYRYDSEIHSGEFWTGSDIVDNPKELATKMIASLEKELVEWKEFLANLDS